MIPILVATLAPIINCIQLVPQLYRTYITKKVKDLSFFSLLLILFTNILWFLHGYFIQDISLIAAGTISIIINSMLFGLYLMYSNTITNLPNSLNFLFNQRFAVVNTILFLLILILAFYGSAI